MKNRKQISLVLQKLTHEKDKFLYELLKVNSIIDKKIKGLETITAYQNDLFNNNNIKLSRETPFLIKNLYSFDRKVSKIIADEQVEIERMRGIKKGLEEKIEKSEKKIKGLEEFLENIKNQTIIKLDYLEQHELDDLAANKESRRESE